MKKCYVILSLLASTSAFGMNQQYVNHVKEGVKNICINLFNEDGPVKDQARMKAFCGRVAKCTVDNAPNEVLLQNQKFMTNSMMSCIQSEAQKEANK